MIKELQGNKYNDVLGTGTWAGHRLQQMGLTGEDFLIVIEVTSYD